jgi:SAM-dependent methyltransferase
VRCRVCGLVFQHPQPDERTLAEAYYHDPRFTEALFGPLRGWTLQQAEAKLPALEAAAGPLVPGRALDVGCSSGAWLEVSTAHGWRATGVEPGVHTARAARERGLDVREGTLADVAGRLGKERFDLITFWDVLEHVRDPGLELELAAGLLAPGGVLAASMPNIEGLYPRLTYRLLTGPTGAWEHPELPVHLYDFSPATISQLLVRSGYRVLGVSTSAIPFSFYRRTSLSDEMLGFGRRARLVRAAFGALALVAYPLARARDRGNQMVVAARVG